MARWLRPGIMLALAILAGAGALAVDPEGRAPAPGAVALWVVAALALAAATRPLTTWSGRQRAKAAISRIWRHEFWPSAVYYAPLLLWLPWLAIRYRGIMTFTCVNRAIMPGGGVIGESKAQILRTMEGDPAVLAHTLIPAGEPPARRLRRLQRDLEASAQLGGWPIVLKPDRGERGYVVRICHGPDDALAYLERIRQDVIAQRFHPGPSECGIFWIRDDGKPHGGWIFSVTRKQFQSVTGDGQRTLEMLVLGSPRLRMQAHIFRQRFADQWQRVLAPGEMLRMSQSGNHAQGALLRDGADLVTDRLAARVGALVGRIEGEGGPGFDFGRMDVRYSSDDALRRGEGLAIVELNGSTSESTNMYDPDGSLLWAWGVLLRQWSAVYRLGASRRAEGVLPLGPLELGRLVLRERSGRRAIASS